MLTLMLNLRPPTPALGAIGRDVAMFFASVIPPVVCEHIPDTAHAIVDVLIRSPVH